MPFNDDYGAIGYEDDDDFLISDDELGEDFEEFEEDVGADIAIGERELIGDELAIGERELIGDEVDEELMEQALEDELEDVSGAPVRARRRPYPNYYCAPRWVRRRGQRLVRPARMPMAPPPPVGYGYVGQAAVAPQPVIVRPRPQVRQAVIRERRPQRWRKIHAGVPPKLIPTGGTETVEIKPQFLFRVRRLVVPSVIASSFVFRDIKVGQRSQLVASGDMPASAFVENAVATTVHWDTADIGNTITFDVTNIGPADETFRATLFGIAVV